MNQQYLSCREAKKKDLVTYLDSLGHRPEEIKGDDYWYRSPLREEKTPSFKVNRKFNIWYDHGIGKGGNLIDFGILYHHCSVKELLEKLQDNSSFHPQPIKNLDADQRAPQEPISRIQILSEKPIDAAPLTRYIAARGIALDLAKSYCKQVEFSLYNNQGVAIGFPNQSGGFELRNASFKGSSSPKDISFIDNQVKDLAVFEGFFSFLSFLTLKENLGIPLTNCLVLNSLAFFEKSRPLMEKHEHVFLFLDNDNAGIKYIEAALRWHNKYLDQSVKYSQHKDLNEWLKVQIKQPRLRRRHGRHI